MSTNSPCLVLFGCTYDELFTSRGLQKLDADFWQFVQNQAPEWASQLSHYRGGKEWSPVGISEFILAVAPLLEAYLARLFHIEDSIQALQAKILKEQTVFSFKKYYVLREARRLLRKSLDADFSILDQWVTKTLHDCGIASTDREWAVATLGEKLLAEGNESYRERLVQWCVAALATTEGQKAVSGWASFHIPQSLDFQNLVPTQYVPDDALGRLTLPKTKLRARDGFQLTDPRMDLRDALNHVHYCVYCHKTDGDFCSKGFPVRKNDPNQGLKINPLGEILTGCPLEEKISEMHFLKKEGYSVGALATIMIDNPMCPATGHRICNDCMKACIYQKQEPVDIPQTETRVLTDVLSLPWGVEIYDLLTRWNPLRQDQPFMKPYQGKKVLVMGMGPAGFTLAHHLLMEGFAVVGMEGLKIEPLNKDLISGPIYRYSDLLESLDQRVMRGFGGVAEYGITVRWDKNFLKLIYISLMRRAYFQLVGSVRFGGTILVEDAWKLGFDHFAVAVGAGLPRELPIPNSLAPGMRQANDFLMALQLTGAAKASSLANLQVRMPVIIIGGGLTGIDTATEVQAYYIAQVEKMYERYQRLASYFGESTLRSHFDEEDLKILDEFLQHAHQVAKERLFASQEGRAPNWNSLIHAWGGVTIIYRRTLQESPAYRRNPEEVTKAFEEGIYYAEGLEPTSVCVDAAGYVNGLRCRYRIFDEEGVWKLSDETKKIPARSLFVATGARPNIAYEYEHRGTFLREGLNYQRFMYDFSMGLQEQATEIEHCKEKNLAAFTSYSQDNKLVTFLGDTHPMFHGSVVKAIASAKRIYPEIVKVLQETHSPEINNASATDSEVQYKSFHERIDSYFTSKIIGIRRVGNYQVELKVRSPMAARNFRPGQFYRLQNYESTAAIVKGTRLQTEALAMLAERDPHDSEVLTFVILERGASSRLVATWRIGEAVSLMGPTGCWYKTSPTVQKTILLVGGVMAALQLRSMGAFLKSHGHRVFWIALVPSRELSVADIQEQHKLFEVATDSIVWLGKTAKDQAQLSALSLPDRSTDRLLVGELTTILRTWDKQFVNPPFQLQEVNEVHIIGSSRLLKKMQKSKDELLENCFSAKTDFIGSVYGPMQCMLKGVCAQCLQWQIDPVTKKRIKAVYACSWQQQPLGMIDMENLEERLKQNKVQEILNNLWLDYLFNTEQIQRV